MHGTLKARLPAASLLLVLILTGLARAEEKPAAKPSFSQAQAALEGEFKTAVRPFLSTHCTSCHGETKPKSGLNLAAFLESGKAIQSRKLWTKVKENLEGTLMPPDGRPQPSRQELEAVTRWIETSLNQADCGRTIDPGRVTIRRLNRAEYNNTIRDLVGIDFRPADDFPSDDVGYGFDNIGDVLTIPPILMEKYLAAAESDGRAGHRGGLVVARRRSRPTRPGASATRPAASPRTTQDPHVRRRDLP